MIEVVFDTNIVIDIEQKRECYKNIIKLLTLEKEGNLKIYIPAIIGSEKTISKEKITNFNEFKKYMKELGFENTEQLKPICYYDLTFYDYCIYAEEKSAKLLEKIHNVLFNKIEFNYGEFCKNRGVDSSEKISKKWGNAIIDALILWSTVYYSKKILVTRDSNFHKHKQKIKKDGMLILNILMKF